MKRYSIILGSFISILLMGCSIAPPKQQEDICEIFREKNNWFDDAEDAELRWGVPIQVMMAFIYQESRFQDEAAPERTWYLGFIPGARKSSAYGYAQAQDPVWDEYRKATRNGWASRDDFDDAVDFVGWYVAGTHQQLKISKWDSKNQYLAYHEGRGGYRQGSYKSKKWLIKVANKVAARASRYGKQLKQCRSDLEGWWPFW